MVLEEATASSPDTFADDASPSDTTDPYAAGPDQSIEHLTVNLDSLPGPPPILGPIFGYRQDKLARTITRGLASAHSIVKRPLRQEEIDAIAYYGAKSYRYSSWGGIVGGMAGIYRATATRGTYRFPFYKPDVEMVENQIIKGVNVRRAMLQGFRGTVYALLGVVIGDLLGTSYGATTLAVGMRADGRLREFMSEMAKGARDRRGELPRQQGQGQGQGQARGQPQGRMAGSEGDRYKSRSNDDDMSPTGGAFLDDATPYGTDTSVMSDEQMRQQEIGQRPDPRDNPSSREDTFRMDKVTRQPRNFEETSRGGRQPADSSSGGSAWDRLRQGGRPSSSTDGSQSSGSGRRWDVKKEQRNGSTLGDSFSFSETEEERQLAKTEAQKDFDARIERERQGGDFADDASPRSRRW